MPRKNRRNRSQHLQRPKHFRRFTETPLHGMPNLASLDVTAMDGASKPDSLAEASIADKKGDASANTGRVLGVDFGEKQVGLAISDPNGRIANGFKTLKSKNVEETLARLAGIVDAERIELIVVGLPVNMDGSAGTMVRRVEQFASQLQSRVACNVRAWDERLTSVAAQRAMSEMGIEARRARGRLDRVAATLLLQNYLDFRRKARDGHE